MLEHLITYWPNYSAIVWGTAVIAVIFTGISKAGFGGGVGVIATPLLALTMPVADAAALMLPLLICADVMTVSHYREQYSQPIIKTLLPGAILGIVLGALFFNLLSQNEALIKSGVGIIAIGFVLFQLSKRVLFTQLQAYAPTRLAGSVIGVVSGFTSTLAHVGGPPFAIYVLPQNLPRNLFVGTTAVFFLTVNMIKLIPYGWLGLLRTGNLIATILLIPIIFIGVRLGVWMNKRVNQTLFNRVVYSLLFLTGIQLIAGRSILSLLGN